MIQPPQGTVTFMFTDIQGSTKLWETYPDSMKAALARHDELMVEIMEAHNGYLVKTTGDGLLAAILKQKTGNASALPKTLETLLKKSGREAVSPAIFAFGYPLIGEKQRGLDWLNITIDQKAQFFWDCRFHPLLEEVWSDPDYAEILSGVGFPSNDSD
jgi:hypothetical protein